MSSYVIAFDDSGGVEPLCDWAGEPIPGDHPITVLTGVFLDRAAEDDFTNRWDALRQRIGRELDVPPPPIHLRLMWGKSLPPKYRGTANPYLNADFQEVQTWIGEALNLYREFARRKALGAASVNRNRSHAATAQTRFFKDERFQAELAFIRKEVGTKAYRGYHNSIVSPLVPLYTLILPHINELMYATRHERIDVLVDSFADAHGIDAVEVVTEMKRVAGLKYIDSVTRVENADRLPLVQAADLVSFVMFRTEMANQGHIAQDAPLNQLLRPPLPMNTLTNANIEHIVRRKIPNLSQVTLAMDYALARSRLHVNAARFVERHMVTVDEFLARAEEAERNRDVGVSVLKISEMAKTPD